MSTGAVPPGDSGDSTSFASTNLQWQLSGAIAKLTSPQCVGELPVDEPQQGLRDLRLRSDGSPGPQIAESILGLQSDSRLAGADAYVRHPDLAIAFPPAGERQFAHTLYWHLVESPMVPGAFELLHHLSLQTELLDVQSRISVVSQISAAARLWMVPGQAQDEASAGCVELPIDSPRCAVCLSDSQGAWVLAISAPSSDVAQIDWMPTPANSAGRVVTHSLRLPSMEKGVIRRFQFAVMLLPTADGPAEVEELVQRWLNQLETAPPPLAT